MNQLVANLQVADFALRPQTPQIGAVVEGLDLRATLERHTITGLEAALLEWKVLFFRDQDITADQHLAFARCFGELEVRPLSAPTSRAIPNSWFITTIASGPGGKTNGIVM